VTQTGTQSPIGTRQKSIVVPVLTAAASRSAKYALLVSVGMINIVIQSNLSCKSVNIKSSTCLEVLLSRVAPS
jgi:hypothetical protein